MPHIETFKHFMELYHIKHQHKKLQTIQKTALCHATACLQDRNTQHLHGKTSVLPMGTYLKLYAMQLEQLTQTETHPLLNLNAYSDPPTNMKAEIFHKNNYTNIIISEPDIKPEE